MMKAVPEEKLYYIYIDTKIIGAVEQLCNYFQARVFSQDQCISVLVKHYDEIEKKFSKLLSQNRVEFKFIKKQSDIILEKSKVIFYLFNAQSNCRMVAYRDLSHIFVTHGESNKAASIKPIIRIYDHVITSGQMGIERYLKSGIFSESDITSGKVISMGDTFIGSNDFTYNEKCNNLIYAPTWEGGVPEEDYSSINIKNFKKIAKFCLEKKITTVYIQSHPNLGHRINKKKKELIKHTLILKEHGIKTILLNYKEIKIPFCTKIYIRKKISVQNKIPVKYALTDISAMEVQFLSKGIPCGVFINDKERNKLTIPSFLNDYYNAISIRDDFDIQPNIGRLDSKYYRYIFSHHKNLDMSTPYAHRVRWLCYHAREMKTNLELQLSDKY